MNSHDKSYLLYQTSTKYYCPRNHGIPYKIHLPLPEN